MTERERDAQRVAGSDAAKQIFGYLQARGISKAYCKHVREVLCDQAIRDAESIVFNRIYTALAKTCLDSGMDADDTVAFLHSYDKVCDNAKQSENGTYWSDLMADVYEETGLIIRTGTDDKFTEFVTDEERAEFQREQNERKAQGLKAETYEEAKK